jgi:hypothetical protein
MRWFTAEADSALIETVTIDGQDITDRCIKFWGSDLPGLVMPGEAEVVDEPARQENGQLVIHRLGGDVVWQEKTKP